VTTTIGTTIQYNNRNRKLYRSNLGLLPTENHVENGKVCDNSWALIEQANKVQSAANVCDEAEVTQAVPQDLNHKEISNSG
jgi:hypothetical protein